MRTMVLAAVIIVFGAAGEGKEGRCAGVRSFAGFVCSDTDWCDYPDGAVCGAGDYFGTCRPRPELCTEIYLPVCGCNGETYSNACVAAAAGTDVAYPGKCR